MTNINNKDLVKFKLIHNKGDTNIIIEYVYCLIEKVNSIGDYVKSYDVLQIIELEKFLNDEDEFQVAKMNIPNYLVQEKFTRLSDL